MVWKNTIATDHTDGEPPKRGSTILVNIGCTANSSAAERKIAAPYTGRSAGETARAGGAGNVMVLSLSLKSGRNCKLSRFPASSCREGGSRAAGQPEY